MKIFVTGATRVLGNAVVPLLIARGHHVQALSRSQENRRVLERMGAEPVSADLFDVESLKHAVAGCDAILHLATRIPPTMQMGKLSAWQENDRIRREGTNNLVEAALAVGGVHTFIYPSFASVYPDSGDRWIDAETSPVRPTPTLRSTLDAEAAVARFAGEGRRGISLRMGGFYGLESPTTLEQINYARKGIATFPGSSDGYLSQIWVPDAGRAIVAALEPSVPSDVYDIVDDEPLTRSEVLTLMAQAVGRKRLLHIPAPIMRMMLGVIYDMMCRSLRISNRRFKEVSDWKPEVTNAREGWARIAGAKKEAARV
ncbi:MAG TPA: NAD(P)-dependent oxidoreductase [Ktedonobacteraceae bacterium]|nr:NAD(P)-dependent oxidoreductase [Ktedonobacteraceae bacterium]